MAILQKLIACVALLLVAVPAVAMETKTRDQQLAERDDVKSVEAEDPQMNAAIAEAQRTLPQFLEFLQTKGAERDSAGFKFPLGGWEHIWVNQIHRDGDYLVGKLGNVPMQENYRLGDVVRVPLADISDWAWRDRKGVMQGHYTTRVLLDIMSPEEAEAVRQALGW